jgi:gliding motility-associated-like protein
MKLKFISIKILWNTAAGRVVLMGMYALFVLSGYIYAQNECPDPTNPCTPAFKTQSRFVNDTAFYNCNLSLNLDPHFVVPPGKTRWTKPDGTFVDGTTVIKAEVEGKYIFCYDTIFSNCPKSDTIVVVKFDPGGKHPRFANAGPDMTICSLVATEIGVKENGPTKYTYSWSGGQGIFSGGSSNKRSNPTLFFPDIHYNNSLALLILTQTDTITGCIDKDSVTITIKYPPVMRIENLKPDYYCTGELFELNFIVHAKTALKDLKYKVNNGSFVPVNSAPSQVMTRFQDFTNDLEKITDLDANLFKVSFPVPKPNPGNNNSIQFSATASGLPECTTVRNLDNILIKDITADIDLMASSPPLPPSPLPSNYCSDMSMPVPLGARKPDGSISTIGTFSVSPASEAISENKFIPSKAVPGVNTLTYTEPRTAFGCGATGFKVITVNAVPTPKISGRSSVCPGIPDSPYLDTANLNGIIKRTWTVTLNAALHSFAPAREDSITIDWPAVPGVATITLTNEDQTTMCTDIDSLTVFIDNNLHAKSPAGLTPLCSGEDSAIYKLEYDPRYYHQWHIIGGDMDPKYTSGFTQANEAKVLWFPGPGPYRLWVRDSLNAGCAGNSDTLMVNFDKNPYAFILNNDTTICKDQELTLRADPAGGNLTWTSQPAGTDSKQATITVKPVENTTYKLMAEKGDCKPKTSEVIVIVNPLPSNPLMSQKDFSFCFEDEADTLLIITKDNPANTLTYNNLLLTNNFITADKAGTYTVVQTNKINGYDCSSPGSITITDDCPAVVYVPQAFSPNQDGSNDSLFVFGKNFQKFNLKIFNRWGQVVYASEDPTKPWSGTFNGQPAPAGVYPWVITYEFINKNNRNRKERATKNGSISLVR